MSLAKTGDFLHSSYRHGQGPTNPLMAVVSSSTNSLNPPVTCSVLIIQPRISQIESWGWASYCLARHGLCFGQLLPYRGYFTCSRSPGYLSAGPHRGRNRGVASDMNLANLTNLIRYSCRCFEDAHPNRETDLRQTPYGIYQAISPLLGTVWRHTIPLNGRVFVQDYLKSRQKHLQNGDMGALVPDG